MRCAEEKKQMRRGQALVAKLRSENRGEPGTIEYCASTLRQPRLYNERLGCILEGPQLHDLARSKLTRGSQNKSGASFASKVLQTRICSIAGFSLTWDSGTQRLQRL
jgi:hypothetical protein